jgi:hypothetical protein
MMGRYREREREEGEKMLWLSRGGVPSLDRSRALIGLAVVLLSCDV